MRKCIVLLFLVIFLTGCTKTKIKDIIVMEPSIEEDISVQSSEIQDFNKLIKTVKRKFLENEIETETEEVRVVIPYGKNEPIETTVSSNYESSYISKYIFIGDSRTEGMRITLNTDDIWSCEVAMGYDWMVNTGIPNIESEISSNSAIIILMGVNDLYNVNNYVNYINQKASEWEQKGVKTYFVSVGPIEYNMYCSNIDIESFNNQLRNGLNTNVKYIDIYTDMINNGYGTTDGTHYTSDTYRNIYNMIKIKISEL